jgi:GAF domain-containing protein
VRAGPRSFAKLEFFSIMQDLAVDLLTETRCTPLRPFCTLLDAKKALLALAATTQRASFCRRNFNSHQALSRELMLLWRIYARASQ